MNVLIIRVFLKYQVENFDLEMSRPQMQCDPMAKLWAGEIDLTFFNFKGKVLLDFQPQEFIYVVHTSWDTVSNCSRATEKTWPGWYQNDNSQKLHHPGWYLLQVLFWIDENCRTKSCSLCGEVLWIADINLVSSVKLKVVWCK